MSDLPFADFGARYDAEQIVRANARAILATGDKPAGLDEYAEASISDDGLTVSIYGSVDSEGPITLTWLRHLAVAFGTDVIELDLDHEYDEPSRYSFAIITTDPAAIARLLTPTEAP